MRLIKLRAKAVNTKSHIYNKWFKIRLNALSNNDGNTNLYNIFLIKVEMRWKKKEDFITHLGHTPCNNTKQNK